MDHPIRILFVDDAPRMRSSWEKIFRVQDDMVLIESLSSADQLPEKVPCEDSVVLMDLSMPGRNPLDVVAELRSRHPQCRVIIYSGHNDPHTVREAVASGAWGLIDKLTPPMETLDAIRRVAKGEAVFPHDFAG